MNNVGIEFSQLCTGSVRGYSFNLVDVGIVGKDTPIISMEQILIKQLEDTVRELERSSGRRIARIYIGNTYIPHRRTPGGGFVPFSCMNPNTWRKAGISSRWRSHHRQRDGLVVLCAVTRDHMPERSTMSQEQLALAMEQRLLHHYYLTNPDPRFVNETFTTGHLAQHNYHAYAVYMAFRYEEASGASTSSQLTTTPPRAACAVRSQKQQADQSTQLSPLPTILTLSSPSNSQSLPSKYTSFPSPPPAKGAKLSHKQAGRTNSQPKNTVPAQNAHQSKRQLQDPKYKLSRKRSQTSSPPKRPKLASDVTSNAPGPSNASLSQDTLLGEDFLQTDSPPDGTLLDSPPVSQSTHKDSGPSYVTSDSSGSESSPRSQQQEGDQTTQLSSLPTMSQPAPSYTSVLLSCCSPSMGVNHSPNGRMMSNNQPRTQTNSQQSAVIVNQLPMVPRQSHTLHHLNSSQAARANPLSSNSSAIPNTVPGPSHTTSGPEQSRKRSTKRKRSTSSPSISLSQPPNHTSISSPPPAKGAKRSHKKTGRTISQPIIIADRQ